MCYIRNIGDKKLGEHKLSLTEPGPVKVSYRRYSWAEEVEIASQIEDWLKKGIIRESTSVGGHR